MLTFYRHDDHVLKDMIEERMKELVVAHKIEMLHEPSSEPYLSQSGSVARGKDEMLYFLDNLERELSIQRSISADACYVDPESGEIC